MKVGAITSRQQRRRGFIMLIVLCVLALVGIAVASTLQGSAGNAGAEVRVADDQRAREAAEACLDMLQAYSDDYMRALRDWNNAEERRFESDPTLQDHSPYFDFDGLLDPDAPLRGPTGVTRDDGDEHVPAFTSRKVYVPKSAVDAEHRFGYVDLGAGEACLVRIEDNSDDGFFEEAASEQFTEGVDEGCNLSRENGRVPRCDHKEVRDRDNDGAVVLVAVGLFPVPPGTSPDSAYDEAHARVGVRRLTSRAENEDSEGEMLNSKDSVTLTGRTEVCGRGGVMATDYSFGPATCTCGDLRAFNYNPANPPDTGCGCNACNATTKTPLTRPIPAYTSWLFGVDQMVPPKVSDFDYSDLVGPDTCMLYINRGGVFFLYDYADRNPRVQGALGAPVTCLPGSKCADKCGITDDGLAAPGLANPCTWDPAAGTVTCDRGESPCWKPIGKLHDGASAAWMPSSRPAGAAKNWTKAADEIAFRRGTPIPNVKSAKTFGGPTPFCGRPDVCDDCDGTDVAFKETGKLETTTGLDERDMPVPMQVFVDLGKDVHIKKTATNIRLPLSFAVNDGDVKIDRDASLCCAQCDCEHEPNPPECYFEFGRSGGRHFEVPFGYVVKSNKDCVFDSRRYMTGGIECRSVDITTNGNVCIHGDVGGYDNNVNCDGDRAAVCIRDSVDEIGIFGETDSAASVVAGARVKQEFDVGITALDKVTLRRGVVRLGASVETNGPIRVENVGQVIDTNPSGFTVKKVLTYMETSW